MSICAAGQAGQRDKALQSVLTEPNCKAGTQLAGDVPSAHAVLVVDACGYGNAGKWGWLGYIWSALYNTHTDRSHHLECVLHAADASRIAWCGHAGALCCECLAALLGRQHLTRKVTQPPRHGLTTGGTQHTTNHSTSTVCQLGFALASPSCQPCTHPVALWFADPAGMLRVACQYTVHTTGAPRARACAG